MIRIPTEVVTMAKSGEKSKARRKMREIIKAKLAKQPMRTDTKASRLTTMMNQAAKAIERIASEAEN